MTSAPRLRDVVAALDARYPQAWAESWDRVGLVVGEPDAPVRRVLCVVDCVPETVAQALAVRADLVVAHHPLLLRGVSSVAATTFKGRAVHRLIKSDVALYVAHTNADTAHPGVSDALADRLGLRDTVPLRPASGATASDPAAGATDPAPGATAAAGSPRSGAPGPPRSGAPDPPPGGAAGSPPGGAGRRGTGRIGRLPRTLSLAEFTRHAAAVLPATAWGVRAAGDPDAPVRTVAVCGGSGGEFLADARAAGVDAYLTADLRHHPVSEYVAEGGPAVVDAAHWATERPWLDELARWLGPACAVDTVVSDLDTDPWTLHAPSGTPAGPNPGQDGT